MNKANPNQHALQPAPEHTVRAAEHVRQHREAGRRLSSSIRAVGELFGRELAEHLERRHEDVGEHAGEAIYHLEERIKEIEHREGRMARALSDKIEQDRRRHARDAAVLSRALAELDRRARRSGKPVPDFVTDYRSDLEQEAPF